MKKTKDLPKASCQLVKLQTGSVCALSSEFFWTPNSWKKSVQILHTALRSLRSLSCFFTSLTHGQPEDARATLCPRDLRLPMSKYPVKQSVLQAFLTNQASVTGRSVSCQATHSFGPWETKFCHPLAVVQQDTLFPFFLLVDFY